MAKRKQKHEDASDADTKPSYQMPDIFAGGETRIVMIDGEEYLQSVDFFRIDESGEEEDADSNGVEP